MKKNWMILLVCTLLIIGAACAETIACKDINGNLYIAKDGLMRCGADGTVTQVTDGDITRIFASGENVYYVKREVTAEESGSDGVDMSEVAENTLFCLTADGTIAQIGEMQYDYYVSEYSDDYSVLLARTTYSGFRDLTVCNGFIYYINNDDIAGSYIAKAEDWDTEGIREHEVYYDSGAAVWRMNPDGSEPTMLISGLGNGGAHLAVANDRIAVASCFINPIYAYDFTNFTLYDLEGNQIAVLPNEAGEHQMPFYTDNCEYTVITDAIRTDGAKIYASLSDSEGDYASSRFVDVADIDKTLAYEAYFTNSYLCADGFLYLTSDAEGTVWEENMDTSLTLHYRDFASGKDTVLAYLPKEYHENAWMTLDVVDGMAYLKAGRTSLIRVPLNGGTVESWTGSRFAADPNCAPEVFAGSTAQVEDYIPDGDTRIYTREDLEQYDTETLAFMRNEILARHGFPFKKEVYREWFGSRPWYVEDPKFSYDVLNDIELKNIDTIQKIEKSR